MELTAHSSARHHFRSGRSSKTSRSRRWLGLGVTLGALASLLPSAGAQTVYTWSTTTTSGTWLTTTNWTNNNGRYPGVGATPGSGDGATNDIAAFGVVTSGAAAIGLNFNNVGGGLTLGAIDFLSTATRNVSVGNSSGAAGQTAAALTLTGVTLNGTANTILSNEGTFTFSLVPYNGGSVAPMTVNLGNATNNVVQISSSGGYTISSVVKNGGGSSLSLVGGGTGALTLSGANTFTGGVTVGAGVLQVGVSSVVAGGAITSGALGTGALTLGTGATLRSSSTSGYMINNNLSLGGAITLGGTTNTGALTFDNTALAAPSATLTADTTLTVSSAVSIADVLSGNFALTKLGTSTLTLSGTNSFTGAVTVGAGSLSVPILGIAGANSPLGTTGTINLGSTTAAGTLVYTGTGETNSKVFNLIGTAFGGGIDQSGASGALKLTTDLTVTGTGAKTFTLQGSTAGAGEFAGRIVDGSGTTSLVKAGTGTWTLSAANTYSGTTLVSNGTLRLGLAGALPAATALTVGTAAQSSVTTFDLAGFNQTVASLQFFGGGSSANSSFVTLGGGTLTVNGTVAFATAGGGNFPSKLSGLGAVDLGGAVRTFSVYSNGNGGSGGGDLQISSIIQNGGLNKTQDGILNLSAANTYAGGTTLSLGSLYLGTSSAVSGGAITSGPVGTGLLTIATGTAVASNAATTAGDRTISNNLSLSGAITLGNVTNTGILTFDNRSLTTPSAVLTADTTLTLNSAVVMNDVLSGSGRSLTKGGAGTLTLGSVNTYDGTTTVVGGSLRSGVSGALVSSTALTLGVASGTSILTSFDLAGFNQTVGSLQFLPGSGSALSSSITLGGGTLTVNGPVTYGTVDGSRFPSAITGAGLVDLGGAVRQFVVYNHTNTGSFGGDLQISSVIQNGGISKTQGGILTLSGANTYAGGTTLSTGGIYFGSSSVVSGGAITSGPLGTGLLTVGTGTTLASNAVTTAGDRTISNNLSLGGAITFGNSTNTGILTFNNTGLTSPSTVLSADTALTLASSATVYNSISGSGRSLSKAGTGYLELAGVNTFSGTYTNSAGITYLDVNGALGSVTGVTVSGGTLTSPFVGLTNLINDAAAVTQSGASLIELDGETETIGSIAGTSTATTGLLIGDYTNTTTNVTYSGSLTVGGDNTSTTYSGKITGVRAAAGALLTKTGTGTLTLSGASTFTGSVLISAGTLKLGAAGTSPNSPLGTVAGGTTVGATGAALDLGGITLATAEPLTLNGTGITNGGALTNSSATSSTYSGLVTLGSDSSIVAGSGNILLTNTGTITGSGFGLTLGGSNNGSITSVIGTGTGTLTKTGAGTWTLLGATSNTYTGLTTVSQGSLVLGKTVASANAISGDLLINGGAVSYVASPAINEQIADTSNVTLSSGTFDLAARTETINSLTMSGGALNKASTALTLSAASSITGGVVTLSVTGSQINANGALAIGGATFSYTNASTPSTGAGLVLGGNVSYAATNPAATVFSNTLAGVGALNLGGATRTFDIAASTTLNGSAPEVQVGWNVQNGGLTKAGTGTLALSAANTYAGGTTVTAGTLLANNASGSATGSGTVGVNGGILGGTGTISGAVTVAAGATLQGGAGAVNTSLTLSSTPILSTAPGASSILQLTLDTSGNHSALALPTGFDGFNANQIFAFTGTFADGAFYNNIITGVASGIDTTGWTISNGFQSYAFSDDGSNIDLQVTTVPEPATVLGGALLVGALGYHQRRRLRKWLPA